MEEEQWWERMLEEEVESDGKSHKKGIELLDFSGLSGIFKKKWSLLPHEVFEGNQ